MLLLPGIVYFLVFKYGSIYGIQLAWKDYALSEGIWASKWIGWDNFSTLFAEPNFWRALKNTFIIGIMQLIIAFPFSIFLALLFNEIRSKSTKKFVQVLTTFPHFLSWVVIASLTYNILGNTGIVNNLLSHWGSEKIDFMTNSQFFRWLLVITYIWKEAGWNAIIYTAAISAINPELYEAAQLDGASRLQTIFYITIPAIKKIIIVMLILQVGSIVGAGYSQVLTLYNPSVYDSVDILDTFVYRATFDKIGNFGVSTAASLFSGSINVVLLVVAEFVARAFTKEGLADEIKEKN